MTQPERCGGPRCGLINRIVWSMRQFGIPQAPFLGGLPRIWFGGAPVADPGSRKWRSGRGGGAYQ
jgi:hypothetical protein